MNMTNPNTLKPCPFCGSEHVLNFKPDNSNYWVVMCECGGESPPGRSPEEADFLWNTRAECQKEVL